MSENHLSDHDLERYYLGLIKDETELAQVEEHILCCPACVERAEAGDEYVDAMRRVLLAVDDPPKQVCPAMSEAGVNRDTGPEGEGAGVTPRPCARS
jgi:anti-sigma factor RsiW